MTTDARTANRNYPKPHTDNFVSEDFARLIDAFDAIDTDMQAALDAFSGYSVVGHTHAISGVTGLQTALDGKAASAHSHALNDLSDVNVAGAANGQILMLVAGNWQPSSVPAGDWSTITNKPLDLAGFGLSTEVTALINALVDAAPGALDTLNELAAALGDDPNFAATMTAALAGKAAAAHGHSGGDITSGTVPIARLPEASAGEFRANTADKLLSTDQVWAAAAFVTMADGATITPNFANGWNLIVTLGGNRTLANPIDWRGGQSGVILIAQDATGSRTLSYGSMWKFPQTPVLTATPGAIDAFAYTVYNGALILCSFIGRVW